MPTSLRITQQHWQSHRLKVVELWVRAEPGRYRPPGESSTVLLLGLAGLYTECRQVLHLQRQSWRHYVNIFSPMDRNAVYHPFWRGKKSLRTLDGYAKQIYEQLFKRTDFCPITGWGCRLCFLITLHLICSPVDAKPQFFSNRIEAIIYSRHFFQNYFLHFF